MPVVTVQMEKGRPVEMKRALSEAVTTAIAGALDIPPDWVILIIDEVERENWAIGGRLQLDKFGPGYGKTGVDAKSGRS
jgi:4-oxalocrotonate tautomerase